MGKISIQEVAKILLDKYGLTPAEAENFVGSVFDVIRTGLDSDRQVKIKGLGTFKIIGVEARESVNVNTGERVLIDSHGKITFTPDTTMKELVNKPFSQFDTVILGEEIDLEPAKPAEEEPEQDRMDDESAGIQAVEEAPETGVEPVEEAVEEVGTPSAETVSPDAGPDTGVSEPEHVEVSEMATETQEPAMEDEPEQKDESEPVIVTDNQTVTEEDAAQEIEEEVSEEGGGSHWFRNLLLIVVTVALICLAAYGGYRYGRYEAEMERPAVVKQEAVKKPVAAKPVKKPDTTAVKLAADTVTAVKRDTVAPVSVPQSKAESDDYARYEEMDNRVKTGAYRIVGTDHVRTVKAGETITGIARRTLGDGMECYIEVYNGIGQNARITEGQRLKIPKLELKRKKRK